MSLNVPEPLVPAYMLAAFSVICLAVAAIAMAARRLTRRDFGDSRDRTEDPRGNEVARAARRVFGPDLVMAEALRERPRAPRPRPHAQAAARPLDLRLIRNNDPGFDLKALTSRVPAIWTVLRSISTPEGLAASRPFLGDNAYSVLRARMQNILDGGSPSPARTIATVTPLFADRVYGSSDPANAYDRIRFSIVSNTKPAAETGATETIREEWLLARRVGAPTAMPDLPESCAGCGARLTHAGASCGLCGAPGAPLGDLLGSWVVKVIDRTASA